MDEPIRFPEPIEEWEPGTTMIWVNPHYLWTIEPVFSKNLATIREWMAD